METIIHFLFFYFDGFPKDDQLVELLTKADSSLSHVSPAGGCDGKDVVWSLGLSHHRQRGNAVTLVELGREVKDVEMGIPCTVMLYCPGETVGKLKDVTEVPLVLVTVLFIPIVIVTSLTYKTNIHKTIHK